MLAMHGGALQGFYSRVLLVPESKLGVAILTNAESGGALTRCNTACSTST